MFRRTLPNGAHVLYGIFPAHENRLVYPRVPCAYRKLGAGRWGASPEGLQAIHKALLAAKAVTDKLNEIRSIDPKKLHEPYFSPSTAI